MSFRAKIGEPCPKTGKWRCLSNGLEIYWSEGQAMPGDSNGKIRKILIWELQLSDVINIAKQSE